MNSVRGLVCVVIAVLFGLGSPTAARSNEDATASASAASSEGSAALDEGDQPTPLQAVFSVFLKLKNQGRASMGYTPTRVEFRDLNGRTIAECGTHYPSYAENMIEVGAGLPVGAVNLWVKPKQCLSRTHLLSFPSDDESTQTMTFIGGDLDDDNSIGLFDYVQVLSFLNISQDDPEWFERVDGIRPEGADLNGDGIIDFVDIEELSDHFGESGE